MKCADFDSWIDNRARDSRDAAARKHAGRCARCFRILAAEDAMEHALRQRFATLPSTFAGDLMARLPKQDTPDLELISNQIELGTPWWARLFQEPAILASLFLGAILSVGSPAVWLRAAKLFDVGSASSLLSALKGSTGLMDSASWVVLCVLLPAALGASYLLFRLTLGVSEARWPALGRALHRKS